MSENNTIGDFRFGLESPEHQARFTESIYRELAPLKEWGALPEGLTFSDIADAIVDTISNIAGMGPIPATELPEVILTALEQLREE